MTALSKFLYSIFVLEKKKNRKGRSGRKDDM